MATMLGMGPCTIKFMLVLDLDLPTHDQWTFEIDVADVGNHLLAVGRFAIYDGIVQHEGGVVVDGRSRLQKGQLGNVLDVAQINRSDSRVGILAWTARRAARTTRTPGSSRPSRWPSRSASSHHETGMRGALGVFEVPTIELAGAYWQQDGATLIAVLPEIKQSGKESLEGGKGWSRRKNASQAVGVLKCLKA